jgi:hypothetical protein
VITRAVVVRVKGGDRMAVEDNETGERVRVRTMGSLAPVQGMCHFRESRALLRRLAPAGTLLILKSDRLKGPGAQAKGYLIRYVHRGRRDLGRRVLAAGESFFSSLVGGPDFDREAPYVRVVRIALREDRGMFGSCD